MTTALFTTDNASGRYATTGRVVVLIGLVWFLAALVLALSGAFDAGAGERPLAILAAIILPVAAFGLAYARIEAFRAWVLALDIRHLILLHSWRMIGIGFVFLYFHGQLPALFALPAGLGDAMAAIGALWLGIALYERPAAVTHRRILMWNSFGLIDFVVAVSMGVLTRTGEIFHIGGAAGSEIMGAFPLALIPGFAVPFYVLTHLIIFLQLRHKSRVTAF